ncbi:MAG: alpha/beta hydrolase, partial [Bacteroidota bacterium]
SAGPYLAAGLDVLLLDYRGYGKSEGKIGSQSSLLADATQAYQWLREQYPQQAIVLSGTSIGTGIAVQLAAKQAPDLLILNSPYYGLQELIREKFAIVPPFIIKYPLQSWRELGQIDAPRVIFHGGVDQLIPVNHGQRLAALDEKISLFVYPNAGHNDLLGRKDYDQELVRQIRKVLSP